MTLNSDLSQRVVVPPGSLAWVDLPTTGLQHQVLERGADALTRTTAFVRYAPGASFDSAERHQGEEIFVLEGLFTDESGTYGPGTYIKNPPGSPRASGSVPGCLLFVKLNHLNAADGQRTVVETLNAQWFPGLVPGLSVMPISAFDTHNTALVRWAPGTRFNPHRHYGGEEIFVWEGVFADEFGRYPAGTWLRSPHLSAHCPFSDEGCIILVKTGHLLSA